MGGRFRSEGKRREPSGVCDACNGYAWNLHQAEIKCWFCETGWMRPKLNWRFMYCPCGWSPLCRTCGGQGYAPVPREQDAQGTWLKFREGANGCVEVRSP